MTDQNLFPKSLQWLIKSVDDHGYFNPDCPMIKKSSSSVAIQYYLNSLTNEEKSQLLSEFEVHDQFIPFWTVLPASKYLALSNNNCLRWEHNITDLFYLDKFLPDRTRSYLELFFMFSQNPNYFRYKQGNKKVKFDIMDSNFACIWSEFLRIMADAFQIQFDLQFEIPNEFVNLGPNWNFKWNLNIKTITFRSFIVENECALLHILQPLTNHDVNHYDIVIDAWLNDSLLNDLKPLIDSQKVRIKDVMEILDLMTLI